MDIEQTAATELVDEARKQTAALQSLRVIALAWTAVAGLALLAWILFTIASNQ